VWSRRTKGIRGPGVQGSRGPGAQWKSGSKGEGGGIPSPITHHSSLVTHHLQFRLRRICRLQSLFLCLLGVLAVNAWAGAWPFADCVIEYEPGPGQWVNDSRFNDRERALGRPYGISATAPDNSSLVTLGDHGWITLDFNRPVWDDPRNPHGLDFIVFGNPTWVSGDPGHRWQEPAFVEISMDANGNGLPDDEWFLVLPNKLPSELVGSPAPNCDTGDSRTVLRHYAEYTPTLGLPPGKTPEEFYTVPDRQSYAGDPQSLLIDEGSGGGDAFDIAAAVKQTSPGVPVAPYVYAQIPYFDFIRITDALAGDSAGELGEISAEIDAVSDVSPLPGGQSIGPAKSQPDGSVISLSQKVVSAVFDGELYVQEEQRSSGIRVKTSDSAAEGDRVDVIGILSTLNGERFLDKASVYFVSSGDPPKVLGMPADRVGGAGLSNIGLLVTTCGRVKAVGSACFYVNDGSLPDPGLKVRCDGLTPPGEGEYVVVTGVGDRQPDLTPVVRVRKQADVIVVPE